MLNVVQSPKGVDVPIRKFQEQIFKTLLRTWGIDETLYNSYGRCYRNKKGNGYIAEVYSGANEYTEVYYNDSVAVSSFFGIAQSIKFEVAQKVDAHLVFFVNLNMLKRSATNRADEEVRNDVFKACEQGSFGFRYKSMELSIENVLKEYTGSFRDDRMKVVDMHPVHCFRLNFALNYQIEDCY